MMDAFDRFMVAFDAWEPAGSSKNMNMEAVMLCHSETNDALSTIFIAKGPHCMTCYVAIWRLI